MQTGSTAGKCSVEEPEMWNRAYQILRSLNAMSSRDSPGSANHRLPIHFGCFGFVDGSGSPEGRNRVCDSFGYLSKSRAQHCCTEADRESRSRASLPDWIAIALHIYSGIHADRSRSLILNRFSRVRAFAGCRPILELESARLLRNRFENSATEMRV